MRNCERVREDRNGYDYLASGGTGLCNHRTRSEQHRQRDQAAPEVQKVLREGRSGTSVVGPVKDPDRRETRPFASVRNKPAGRPTVGFNSSVAAQPATEMFALPAAPTGNCLAGREQTHAR